MALAELVLALAALRAQDGGGTPDLAALVDPFVGTGGHGHTHPAATVPFGMVQLGPDTRLEGWDGCSGYHWTDSVIHGFSHTHLSGTGIPDYGDVLFAPGVGPENLSSGPASEGGRGSGFQKETEVAEPGYYAVRLDHHGIDVELTATARAGLHRYAFPAGEAGHVVVDLAHRDRVLDSFLRIAGPRTVEGMRRSSAWAADQRVYFAAELSRPLDSWALAEGGELLEGAEEARGEDVRAVLRFAPSGDEPLLVRVGLSAVDVEGARRNLAAELDHWDFDRVRAEARAAWNAELGRILVEGGTRERRRTFYTALYHAFLAPNLFSDVDGRYRGTDGEVHRADHPVYTVFSIWDTFRSAHPLFTLVQRERTEDFLRTFLRHFEDGGRLPMWELAGNYTGCMIGYHAVSVIADALVKGIGSEHARELYGAMRSAAGEDRLGKRAYRERGYVPADEEHESVSKTLEYAYDDWCVARVAGLLGEDEDRRIFLRRSQAWRHLFDPDTGFFRARANGGWTRPFDPREVNVHYTEANAWQYAFFVPHDVEELARLHGGDEAFAARLDALFEADRATTGRDQPDITGLLGQYAHGNEPSHHVAWLYAYAGRPWRTHERVRQVLDAMYSDRPDGLCGNEDCGQMSAWYVLSAIGLYPVCPGTGDYVLGSPLFERAELRFEDGRAFSIDARRSSPDALHVRGAELDGEPWRRGALPHDRLAGGGSLVLALGDEPSTWATAPEDRPRSRAGGERVLAAPVVDAPGPVFRGSLEVELRSSEPGARLAYTLDGTEPGPDAALYARPLVLADDAVLRVVARADGRAPSPVVTARFRRLERDWSLVLGSAYAPEYAAGGDLALIDGLRGGPDFRLGGWQGYRGSDVVATVDLGEVRSVRTVAAGFLQDVGAWIWLPRALEVAVSADGRVFETVARVEPDLAPDDREVASRELEAELGGVPARWVRVVAESRGPIPDWHPGRGEPGWIFADEIRVE